MPAVILTGFMGTGKTAVGRRLAQRLGLRFVDTDAVIEQREHRSIAQIFASQGEAYFRALEKEVVAEVSSLDDAVIATGGGTIVDEENFRQLRAAGPIICLMASVETIKRRTTNSGRPLLKGKDRQEEIRQLLEKRDTVYGRVRLCIDTSALNVGQVVEIILALLREGEAAATS